MSEHPPPAQPLGGSGDPVHLETVAEFTIELAPPYLMIVGRTMTWRLRLDRTCLVVEGDWIELQNIVDPSGEWLRIQVVSPSDRGAAERLRTTVDSWQRRELSAGEPAMPPAPATGPPARASGTARVPEAHPPAWAEGAEEPAASRLHWRPDPSPASRPGAAASEPDPRDAQPPAPAGPAPPPPAPAESGSPLPEPAGPAEPELVAMPAEPEPPAGPPPPICGPPVLEHADEWLVFAPLADTLALSRGELFEPEGGR